MDRKQKKSDEDIQTDAHIDPDDNNVVPSSPVSPHNESVLSVQPSCKHSSDSSLSMQSSSVASPRNESVLNVQPYCKQSSDASLNMQPPSSEKSFTSSPRSLLFAQTARPITSVDDEEYLKHIEQLPDDLREENIDILIVNAESDRKAAAGFQNHLKKDIIFSIYGQSRRPRVKLLEEIRHGSMDNLDFAFSKALYVFLFVSKDFCEEPWTLLKGQACLTEAIHDSDKKWCVVPIHTTSKKIRRYKLPMMLNTLRPINYWSGDEDQFYIEGVRKLLESKTSLLLERERQLDERRKQYFEHNRDKILENEKYKDKGRSVDTNDLSYHTSSSNYSPLTYPASAVEDSSKLSAVHTSSSDGNVYQTDVYRYSSFTDTHDDKAVPDVSLAVVQESMEEMAVSENVAVVQDNDLHVNIRCSTTDRSRQRPNQEAAHQLSDGNCEMSERIQQVSGRNHESQNEHAQQVSTRSHERQSQSTPLQVSGRNHERRSQDTPQQVSSRSHERLCQGTLQQMSSGNHERLGHSTPQHVSGRRHAGQNEGSPQQVSGRRHAGQNEGSPQQVSGRCHESQNGGTPQQASGRSYERQSQDTHHQVRGRSHESHNQSIPQRSQISTVNAVYREIEHNTNRNNAFTPDEFNSIDVDGPEGDSSSFPAHENQASHLYQHRSVPATTELYQSNTYPAPAHFSAPQYMPSRTANPGYPTSLPMLGHVNYPLPNYVNAVDPISFMPRYIHPAPFYPYYNPHPHPHLYPPFPSQHYPPGQPYTLQDLYIYANPISPPNYFFQTEMRSQSQTSLVGPSNDSTQTSMEGNTPDSVRSDLSHSSSTGALSAFSSSPGLSNHWPPSENLSYTNVPFPPQPASNRYIPTSDPQNNQPVEVAPAITAQQPQSHIPVAQGSFEANYFGTGQTVGAADTPSSAKSDTTPSAGPSSATSVIQHIHHHHHKKNITVAKATNVLIGDKSQILNKNLVDVISDNESGGDDGDEDDAEASASRRGASNFTRFRENSSGSHKNSRAPSDHVQSGNEDIKNVSMGFTEFLSPASCRQPVERSEIEYSVSDDGKDQTCQKLM